jgi:hypothetical protein
VPRFSPLTHTPAERPSAGGGGWGGFKPRVSREGGRRDGGAGRSLLEPSHDSTELVEVCQLDSPCRWLASYLLTVGCRVAATACAAGSTDVTSSASPRSPLSAYLKRLEATDRSERAAVLRKRYAVFLPKSPRAATNPCGTMGSMVPRHNWPRIMVEFCLGGAIGFICGVLLCIGAGLLLGEVLVVPLTVTLLICGSILLTATVGYGTVNAIWEMNSQRAEFRFRRLSCIECGYSFRGISQYAQRCPECGAVIRRQLR